MAIPAQVTAPHWAGMQLLEGGIVLESWDLDLSPSWSRAGFEAGPGMAWGQLKSLAELPPCHVFRVGGSFGMGSLSPSKEGHLERASFPCPPQGHWRGGSGWDSSEG